MCDMTPRWMIERCFANREREILQTIVVYAEGESKELVKQENKRIKHKRELILIEKAQPVCDRFAD